MMKGPHGVCRRHMSHRVIHVQLESEFCFILFFSFVPSSIPAAVEKHFVFTVYKEGFSNT